MIATLAAGLAHAEPRRTVTVPTGTPEERLGEYAQIWRSAALPTEPPVAQRAPRVVRLVPEKES
jgi:hypothetical protein